MVRTLNGNGTETERELFHDRYCKFPLAYGETMTVMTPYDVIGWEGVNPVI